MGRYNSGASTNLLHIISDFAFGLIAFILTMVITGNAELKDTGNYLIACFTFLVIFFLANKESRVYNVTTFFYADRILRCVTKSFLIATAITSTLLYYVGSSYLDRVFYVSFLIISYTLLLASAFLVRRFIKRFKRIAPRVLLVGDISRYTKFEHFLNRSNMETNIIGYVSMLPTDDKRYLGSLDNLEELIHTNAIDQIYIMHRHDDPFDMQPYIDICMNIGTTCRVIISAYRRGSAQTYVSSVGTYPVVTYHTVSLNRSAKALKRLIDIIGSSIGILIFSPFMLLTAIAVKIDSKGPILFKQTRVGLNGRNFKIFKFRSMCIDAEEKKKDLMKQNEMGDDRMFKIKNDPRVTRVGKVIRRLSLDELPQFFNVFIGDMSLVGTRPPTLDEAERYDQKHWRRMSIKPGVTGIWQVSGRSTITDFDEIVELDTQYIDKWSVTLDIRIILKTAWQLVFKRHGAY